METGVALEGASRFSYTQGADVPGEFGATRFWEGGSRRLRGDWGKGGCRNGSAGWTGPIGIIFRIGSKKGTFRREPK